MQAQTPISPLRTKLKILSIMLCAVMCPKANPSYLDAVRALPVGKILAGISNITIGMQFDMGRVWCQAIGAGCSPGFSSPTSNSTSSDSNGRSAMEESGRRRNNAHIEGGLIVNGLQNFVLLGNNDSASTDMRLLALELEDMTSFDEALPWSKDLARMAPSYKNMREKKVIAFSRTLALLQNVVDRHNNAMRRRQSKHLRSSWYNRPSPRDQYDALSTDMSNLIRQYHDEVVQTRLSLSVTEKEANTILEISDNMRVKVKNSLRKHREYRKQHPIVDGFCHGVGDFDLGPVVCNSVERGTMISLLEVLVGTLDHYISDTEKLVGISKSLLLGLYSFGGAPNDTAGVLPYHEPIHLRSSLSDLLLLGDGVSVLSANLNEIDLGH